MERYFEENTPKGRALADPPKDVRKVFQKVSPDASFASWAIRKAQELMNGVKSILCTVCRYCTAGFPKQIPIPEIFGARNQQLVWSQLEEEYAGAVENAGKAVTVSPATSVSVPVLSSSV